MKWMLTKNTSATNLAVMRILVSAYMLIRWKLAQDIFYSETSAEYFQPIGVFRLLSAPLSQNIMDLVFVLWMALSFLTLVGFYTRYVMPIWLVLSIVVMGYDNNFGSIGHSSQMILMAAIILSLSRCADVLSIDAFQRRCETRSAWDYQWPLVAMRLLVIYTLFVTGLQKLYFEGWDWALSNKFYLTIFGNPVPTPFAQWVLDQPPWVAQALAFYSMVIVELLAPLALFSPFNLVYPVIWSSMHLGISITFGGFKPFFSQIIIYLCFYNFAKFIGRNNPNH